MEKTTGLVLGKFAPFHKGHELLIKTALSEVDRVQVLIYQCPETISIPLHVRASWIRELYPQTNVIEAWDGPTESGHSKRIKKLNEDYILKNINEPITNFYSSEWYGKHVSSRLGAKNRIVDLDRKQIPISGTKIRKNIKKSKKYLSNIVYKSLMNNKNITKVVFLGAESTGKSTLTEALAKKHKTVWMPEYGREYWFKYQINNRLSREQLVEIAEGHLEREEKLLSKAKKYLFVDTNAITTQMFSHFYHGDPHPKLIHIARECEKRYGYYFVCDIDIPYDDDNGTRNGAEHRIKFQKQILDDLKQRNIPYTLISGTLKERIKKVEETLKNTTPWTLTK